MTTKHNELIQEERKKTCNHLTAGNPPPITPKASGCADCEREGIMDWLDCGFVLHVVISDVTIHPKECMQQSISSILAILLLLYYLIELGNGAILISCTDSQWCSCIVWPIEAIVEVKTQAVCEATQQQEILSNVTFPTYCLHLFLHTDKSGS